MQIYKLLCIHLLASTCCAYTYLHPTEVTHFTGERRLFVVGLFLRCCLTLVLAKIIPISAFNRSEFLCYKMTTTQQPYHLNVPMLTTTNYHEWRMACTTAAQKSLPTNGTLGGLGLLLPPAEYAALNHNVPYAAAVPPPNVNNAFQTHQQTVFDREQVARGALTAAVFESIPLATQQACPGYHAMYGASFIQLPDMMNHVHAKFGDASVNAYIHAKTTLQQPYVPGTDIDVFLATQVEAHLACIRAGNPLNDIDKVDALICAVGGRTGPFSFTISAFEEENSSIIHRKFEDSPPITAIPEVAAVQATAAIEAVGDPDNEGYTPYIPAHPGTPYAPGRVAQEQREGLASRIRKAAPRILDAPAVPTTKGYFGAAEVVSSLQDSIKAAVAEAVTSANAASRRDAPRREFYCWTHGLGGHTGTQCKNPRTGHNPRATTNKRMGGSNKGCPK